MNKEYTNEDLRKDMRILKIENAIQTGAVIILFFFGVATLRDFYKK
jgi:hypothetical protein